VAEKPFRVLPRVTPLNEPFWRGGAQGELRFLRCRPCGHFVHPPSPRCPRCLGRELAPEAVSGRGTVLTFTWNHQPWVPAPDHPYAIAIVELVEQPGLRLTTNVLGCTPESLRVGLPVRVRFEVHGEVGREVWIPLFEPEPGSGAEIA
jgi:uncharacterized OB-fold protein